MLFRYVVTFSMIVILIILVMGGYLYRFYYRTIFEDFTASGEIYLDGIVNHHENDMAIISNIVLQMGLDSSITDFLLDDNPVKSMELKERLYQYDSVSQFFEGIFCVYHRDTYLYNHATSVELSRFLQKGLLLEKTKPLEFQAFLYNSENGLKVLPEQGTDGYLAVTSLNGIEKAVIYAYPVAPKNATTLVFVVGDKYYTGLLGNGEENRTDYIVYDGKIIVSRGEADIGEDELLRALDNMRQDSERILFSTGKYLLTRRTGESGLVYCTVVSMDVFKDKMLGGQWGIFVLLALCSIPTALIITLLTRNMFGKVRSLNVLLADEEGYNLDTVEAGIRTLVESREEQEKESMPLRKSRFIRTLVQEDFESREAVYEAAEEAKINICMPWYIVVLMGDRGNRNQRRAYELMLDVIGNETLVDGYGVNLLNKNQSLFVLFGEEKKFLDIISRFFLQIGKDYCDDFVLAVSDFHSDVGEVSKAYLEANSAYDSRLLMDNGNVIHFEALQDTETDNSMSETYLQQLKNVVYMRDEDAMRRTVAEICRQMRTSNQSLLKFRLFYNDVIHMLMKEFPIKESEMREIYNVFTLSQCLTLQDFNDILCELCVTLMHKSPENRRRDTNLADEAVKYMKAHYMEYELNMSSLAEYLKVTPANLSVEFKNGMGMNPSDYLASIRLERAKNLLAETNMLVKEISQAVGYEDDHMFMRRFKKYTGKTPGQYREEHTKQKADSGKMQE